MSADNLDPTETALLDAARELLMHVGLRRMTMSDVARRAQVSRMTVYRRWPDLDSLVSDVMTREWHRLVLGTAPAPDGRPARERLVDHLVATVTAFGSDPLFRKIVEVDPELLLPYLLDRRGSSQDFVVSVLEEQLLGGHADGSVQPGSPAAQARLLLLLGQSFVLSAPTMADDVPLRALTDELRTLLDRYLRPEPGPAQGRMEPAT